MSAKKKKENIDLDNPDFKSAWQLLQFTRNSVFLTGKAGAGKSTFLRYITGHTRKKHVVLAPTGIAAVNVGGQTIHSFFRLPLKPVLPDDPDFAVSRLRERMKYPRSLIKLIKNLELIIIDEISMVRADTIDFIDKLLRVFGGNMREPFGGKQLLLVGDIFQLEPVVTPDMRQIMRVHYPYPYFFCAKAFSEIRIVPIELRKVYRQTDNDFISLLDRIRLGRQTKDDIALLNTRYNPLPADDESGPMVMTLATRRDMVDHINEHHLDLIRKPAFTYRGKVSGDFPESSLPTPMELTLKEGAQVVFIKNDRERRWVNGTVGKVRSLDADSLEIELEDGAVHIVEPEVWSNIRYEYDEKTRRVAEKEIGSYVQYPVRLAWALTIHKSQGLTFNRVVVDMGRGAFSSGQSYVALSRCTSLEGMELRSPLSERDVIVNPAITRFSTGFNDPTLIDGALQSAKADSDYAAAAAAADSGDCSEAFRLFVAAMRSRNEIDNEGAMRLAARKVARMADVSRRLAEAEEEIGRLHGMMAQLAGEYVAMGDDCRENGLLEPALANYEKALGLDKSSLGAVKGIAAVYADSGENDLAMATLRQALDRFPGEEELYIELSQRCLDADALHDALETMLRAADIFEKSAPVHEALADVYDRVGDDDEARLHRTIARKIRRQQSGKR